MPAGSAGRKLAIKRAIYEEALAFHFRSLAVCVPGDTSALSNLTLLDEDEEEDAFINAAHGDHDVAWMTTEPEIDRLIYSSLELGQSHFPQVGQEPVAKPDPGAAAGGGRGECLTNHVVWPA